MEARGEKFNVSSGPSKEIAGLKKMMKMMMTPRSQDSRVWGFSYEALKVRRGPLGLCVGAYGPLECSDEFLKLILAVLAEFEAVLYADHGRFHSGHPYIDRLPTVWLSITYMTD